MSTTATTTPLQQRMQRPGPKKILSCDGGGIRGIISVEILARIESTLREQLRQPNLVLADYFDFVCGTSTGAIIATCIAAGMSMAQIRGFYLGSGERMFDKAPLYERFHHKYGDEALAALLQTQLNTALGHQATQTEPFATLGSPALRCVLMLVMRNHSTDSPWPVSNNPYAKYNQPIRADCNLRLPLWQLVRASTAAPTYFPPEVVHFDPAGDKPYTFTFVDGGITSYNNPAFLAFQMATAAPYHMNWPADPAKLLLVAVGTGAAAEERLADTPGDMHLIDSAKLLPAALMNAASAGWDMACRTLGNCRFGPVIDREFGTMLVDAHNSAAGTSNFAGPKLFSYLRYNPELTPAGLAALGLGDIQAQAVRQLDAVAQLPALQRIGTAYATQTVQAAHWAGFV